MAENPADLVVAGVEGRAIAEHASDVDAYAEEAARLM
jgi:hypothetical protein